jgi:hypothetical protein
MSGTTEAFAVQGTLPIVDRTGRSLVSNGFQHNYITIKYFADKDGSVEVVPSSGCASLHIVRSGIIEKVAANSDSHQSFRYNGDASYGEITFTGIKGAVSSRITVVQNKN